MHNDWPTDRLNDLLMKSTTDRSIIYLKILKLVVGWMDSLIDLLIDRFVDRFLVCLIDR